MPEKQADRIIQAVKQFRQIVELSQFAQFRQVSLSDLGCPCRR